MDWWTVEIGAFVIGLVWGGVIAGQSHDVKMVPGMALMAAGMFAAAVEGIWQGFLFLREARFDDHSLFSAIGFTWITGWAGVDILIEQAFTGPIAYLWIAIAAAGLFMTWLGEQVL